MSSLSIYIRIITKGKERPFSFYFVLIKKNKRNLIFQRQKLVMASEGLRVENPDSIEALSREAEALKARLAEEKAKLNDVDCK